MILQKHGEPLDSRHTKGDSSNWLKGRKLGIKIKSLPGGQREHYACKKHKGNGVGR